MKIRIYYYVYKLSMIYSDIKINKQKLYIKYDNEIGDKGGIYIVKSLD